MDTCTISRKQKTSLVKPEFSQTGNTIPWHKKKQNKSSERKYFNFVQTEIFRARINFVMKDDKKTASEMHRKKQISQLGWNDRTPGYEAGPGLVGFLRLQTHHYHKYPGEERVCSVYSLQPIIRGNQTGTRGGWEPGIWQKQRP